MLPKIIRTTNYFLPIGRVYRKNVFSGAITKCISASATKDGGGSPVVDLAYSSYENIDDKENKSPIIILHGFLGSKSNWNSLSKALHKNTQRKVIALDARNHGESPHTAEHSYELMMADLVQLMDRLNIPKANLLGHSMGGRTAMLTALKHPQLVSSLIVVDISPVSTSSRIYSMDKILNAMAAVKLPSGVSLAMARKITDQQLSSIPDRDTRNFILTNLVQSNDVHSWRLNLSSLKANFATGVAKFPTLTAEYPGPTQFICGALSDYVRESDFDEIKKLFPAADIHSIPGAGHWVHSEKPAAFLELACSFLQKH